MAIQERVSEIFRDVFDNPTLEVTPAMSAADLADWDSVAQVKLVFAMQDAFDVRLATEEISSLSSVGAFLEALRKRGIAD